MMPQTRRTFILALLAVIVWGTPVLSSAQTRSGPLNPLRYPARVAGISVLDCYRENVDSVLGKGFYSQKGGHVGCSYYTDLARKVIMRVEWGVDWRVEMISFSLGDKEDMPERIDKPAQLPDSAVASALGPKLTLAPGIGLGISPNSVVSRLGRPNSDSTQNGIRTIQYETDYQVTEDVLFYELRFIFKGDRMIRFTIYNGE